MRWMKMKKNNVKSQMIRVAAFGLSMSMASQPVVAFAAEENVSASNEKEEIALDKENNNSTDESAAEEAAKEYQEQTDEVAAEVSDVNDAVDELIDKKYEKEKFRTAMASVYEKYCGDQMDILQKIMDY